MDLKEVGCEKVYWIKLAQYRVRRRSLMNRAVINFGSHKRWEWATISFSRSS